MVCEPVWRLLPEQLTGGFAIGARPPRCVGSGGLCLEPRQVPRARSYLEFHCLRHGCPDPFIVCAARRPRFGTASCRYIDWPWGDLCLAVRPLHSLCSARIFFVATVGT